MERQGTRAIQQTVPFPITLNDPLPRFQGHAIFLTLNISETANDTPIVAIEYE